jgi:hypothetical protein
VAGELRALRQSMQTGAAARTSWWRRLADAAEPLRHLRPSQYAWFALGSAGVGLAVYLSQSMVGWAGLVFLVVVGAWLYRHIRNRASNVRESFVRQVAKLPEVRLIAVEDRRATVVVDHPVAQLYGRINGYLGTANRKLYSGQPMTVSILHEISPDEFARMLAWPGVHYVRDDHQA